MQRGGEDTGPSESQAGKDRAATSDELPRSTVTDHRKTKGEAVAAPVQHRLKLPAFEWYLGPMYQRCDEILAERAAANCKTVVRKRVVQHVPPEPPWAKHVTSRTPVYKFSSAVHERPLMQQSRVHINVVQNPESALPTPRSARTPRDENSAMGSARRKAHDRPPTGE